MIADPWNSGLTSTSLARLPGGLPHGAACERASAYSSWRSPPKAAAPYGYAYRLHVARGSTRLGTIERGEADGYRHSAYTLTPDGQYVLSGGQNGVLWPSTGLMAQPVPGWSGIREKSKPSPSSADGRWAALRVRRPDPGLWSLAELPASGHLDMAPALTLFPATNGAWVAWTPEGFFAASNNGEGARLIGYSLNQGVAALAQYVSVEQLYERFYRPDLLSAQNCTATPPTSCSRKGALIDVDTVLPRACRPRWPLCSPRLTSPRRSVRSRCRSCSPTRAAARARSSGVSMGSR